MPMIVSRNKPRTEGRWLLCDDKRPYADAKPFTAVIAVGVKFAEASFASEKGFGAQRVALCKGAQGYVREIKISSIPSHCFLISFDGQRFLDPQGNEVEECDMLYFMHDGSMFGALVQKTAAEDSGPSAIAA